MSIKSYKRRPIVEAVEYTGENFDEIADWCGRISPSEGDPRWSPGYFQKLHDGTVMLVPPGRPSKKVLPGYFVVRNEHAEWEAYDPVQFVRLFGEILA